MKYKVGDKVRVRDDIEVYREYKMEDSKELAWINPEMLKFKGEILTITEINQYGKYSVKEDNELWSWTDEMFSGLVASLPKVVITTDGKTTTAKMYEGKKLLKTADSKCSTGDTFDFAIGAKLALESVTEKEPKFKIGQFVRVINNDMNHFPIGQIVQIIDFDKYKVLCEGYCCDRRCIDEQIVYYYQIEALPEDGE